MTPENDETILAAIHQFRKSEKWLWSLITDPEGQRYFQEKSAAVRLQEFKDQINRTHDFLDAIGNPEIQFSSIHIAGTSGKGSVVSMLAEMLTAAGLHTGHHVSPYLQVCLEKMIVDDRLIKPSEFTGLVQEFQQQYLAWQAANGRYSALKYGEAWVVLTMMWMARQQVDWAVIETGLGGRYDPTNVVPAKLAVITNVDYDHTEVLGETLPEIAYHKAGIIKPDSLAITSETKPDALAVIKAEADKQHAHLFCLGEDFDFHIDRNKLNVQGVYHQYNDLQVGMKGDFQLHNAALAVAALDLLAGEMELPFDQHAAAEGLLKVNYPGRLEVMQERPVVILDGAHNRNKAETLVASLEQLYPGKRMDVILGTLSIKDFSGIIHALLPVTKQWVATQPHVFGKPAAKPEQLVEVIRSVDPLAEVQTAEDVVTGLKAALVEAGEDDIILVTGSLYMIGDARAYWVPTDELLYQLETQTGP